MKNLIHMQYSSNMHLLLHVPYSMCAVKPHIIHHSILKPTYYNSQLYSVLQFWECQCK